MNASSAMFLAGMIFLFTLHDPGVIRHDRSDRLYLELAQEPQFDAVARVTVAGELGSAVLIAPSWFITARHVVRGRTGSVIRIDVQGQRYVVDRVVPHEVADLALLHVSASVHGITPAVRYRSTGEVGRIGVSVGYGITGRGSETIGAVSGRGMERAGVKRAGMNVIDEVSEGNVLQADFDHPDDVRYNSMGAAEALELEYFPWGGDSGGGLFVRTDDGWMLVGVTIAGTTPRQVVDSDGTYKNSLVYGWISQWHRISSFNSWIDAHVGSGSH